MYYHYLHGVQRNWREFFVHMIILDLVTILLLLAGLHWYNNQVSQHDALLLRDWCQRVMCVQIDPVTGIGTPLLTEQKIKLSEI